MYKKDYIVVNHTYNESQIVTLTIAIAIGTAIGRIGCISAGCCYPDKLKENYDKNSDKSKNESALGSIGLKMQGEM